MKISLLENEVNYVQYGSGKDIVLLHGWGQNIQMMRPIGDKLCDKFRITIIDFPGFGESNEPKEAWDVDKYTTLVEELVKKLDIKNPIMIGHSFGGRVSIKYSSRNKVDKVVLFGSPCIRNEKNVSKKVKFLKKIKKIPGLNLLGEFMKKFIGSRDYKAASPIMRQTLVNVVNEDLSEDAKKIKAPTLLIWGENDTEAPLEDAKELEKILKDGALIVLPGTHYAYLENLNHVIEILNKFF